MSTRLRLVIITLFAVTACSMLIWFPPIKEVIVALLEWMDSMGPWGPVLFVIIYIAGCLLFMPGSLLTIGAGFIFGLLVGTITVSIGSTLGAGAAFLLSRTVLREWVDKAAATMPDFRALDEAVGREGFKVVLLTRLSPLFPFNLLNFAFGITRVSFWDYMLASWLGMLPGAVVYVYIGTAAKSLADVTAGRIEPSTVEQVFFGVGLVMTVFAVVLLMRVARRSLAHAMSKTPPGS